MNKKLLLDTHIILWWLQNPEKLPQNVLEEIRNPYNNVYVSSAAIWEMAIKKSLGKLNFPENILKVIESDNIEILAINAVHTLKVAELTLHHNDPFDRVQIAQAIEEDMTFVTKDNMIKLYDLKAIFI
ncbi:MAG: toxin-antitoxin system toxin component [Rickettsiaceae bacterium]|jgi:PIN domain nuclease of toxin-antitoxin system|nr:toxin-antitoxin system toxin component [Rickettsiaceae bacterium]